MARPPVQNRPHAPRTEHEYKRALIHCFGSAEPPFVLRDGVLRGVSRSRMVVVCSAIRRACERAGHDPEPVIAGLPMQEWRDKHVTQIPADPELDALEAASHTLPIGRGAAVMLALKMGLRASEILSLSRASVKRAYDYGDLLVMRKGRREQVLPAKHVREQFEELLNAPRTVRRVRTVADQMHDVRAAMAGALSPLEQPVAWSIVGEIFSTGKPIVQYHALREAVKRMASHAGISLRPHQLRHAFATRMIRKGAPLSVVQWMLDHHSPLMTGKYIHPESGDAEKYL